MQHVWPITTTVLCTANAHATLRFQEDAMHHIVFYICRWVVTHPGKLSSLSVRSSPQSIRGPVVYLIIFNRAA